MGRINLIEFKEEWMVDRRARIRYYLSNVRSRKPNFSEQDTVTVNLDAISLL